MIEKIAENRSNGVTFIVSPELAEQMVYDSFCNNFGYLASYGFTLDYSNKHYSAAKKKLKDSSCLEDVLMQILRDGNHLMFIDTEGDNETTALTLQMIHENISFVPHRFISDYILENDDAETSDVILQCVLFKDIIFG